MNCPNCATPVLQERWDAGYRYCKSSRCFEALGRRRHVPLFEKLPNPEDVDLSPFELDDIQSQYDSD